MNIQTQIQLCSRHLPSRAPRMKPGPSEPGHGAFTFAFKPVRAASAGRESVGFHRRPECRFLVMPTTTAAEQMSALKERCGCRPTGKLQTTAKRNISMEIQFWPIDRLVVYARNPRRNDAAVDLMCRIREFGFKIPGLVRRDSEGGAR
jgi:hypothetical protein